MTNKSAYNHYTKLAKGRQYIAKKRMAECRNYKLVTNYSS